VFGLVAAFFVSGFFGRKIPAPPPISEPGPCPRADGTLRLKQSAAAKLKTALRSIALVLIITLPDACLDCDIETNLGYNVFEQRTYGSLKKYYAGL
jgi:hypothetical protein